ncbi:50S ribosomal protein L32 [Bifidobacterium catulorum]|uniref:Large ribosomal subunit protein bL32 n=1 Tax=Bifidobacterium catulorum TaxID=1630173 RepID=A0A2U2MS49_9BIFI|nr:50S ribosomal protein L32 [Bifidobacterium catulorum]PWG59662.1 50S ribosomal protein L32 [Bifidobacterium catulorum]
MAHPKVRKSRANMHSRRANWKAKPVDLATVTTPDGRTVQVPQHLSAAVRKGYVEV